MKIYTILLSRFTPAALASGSSSITLCVRKHGGAVYKATNCNEHDSSLAYSSVSDTE